jgi:hypothetical protein
MQTIHQMIGLSGAMLGGGTSLPALIEKIKAAGLTNDFTTFVPLDNNSNFPGIHFSGIAVANFNASRDTAAYYVYLLEDSNPTPLEPIRTSIGNEQVEIPRTAEQAIDSRAMERANQAVIDALPKGVTCIASGMSVIGTSFNAGDQTQLRYYVNLAMVQNGIAMVRLTGIEPTFSLTQVRDASKGLACKIETVNNPVILADGIVIDAGQKVVVRTRTPNAKEGTSANSLALNSAVTDQELVTVYIKTELIEVQPVPEMGPMGMPVMSKKCWAPRIHITHVESRTQAGLSLIWLAIYGATEVARDYNWAVPFLPVRDVGNTINLREIAALNLVAKYYDGGQLFDTRSPSFTLAELKNYLDAVIQNQPQICIDVIGGVTEHMWLSAFTSAANGNPEGADLTQKSLAQFLGHRLVTKESGLDMPTVLVTGSVDTGSAEVAYCGEYTTNSNQKRPITEIDFCAVAALTNGDAETLLAYQQTTIAASHLHGTQRAHRRFRLHQHLLPTAVIRRILRTVIIPGGTIQAMRAAMEQICTLHPVEITNPLVNSVPQVQMSAALMQHGLNLSTLGNQNRAGAASYTGAVL